MVLVEQPFSVTTWGNLVTECLHLGYYWSKGWMRWWW